MGNYKLTVKAESDLARIWEYGLKSFGEEQADFFLINLFDRFDKIVEHPRQCPVIDWIREGYRRCVFKGISIFYKIKKERIEIIRLVGRQNVFSS